MQNGHPFFAKISLISNRLSEDSVKSCHRPKVASHLRCKLGLRVRRASAMRKHIDGHGTVQ